LGGLAVILNTEYIFGLLGRSATMTGRIPLWHDLLLNVYTKKPVIGYGYGALWMQQDFRHFMQLRHGWKYEVFFADNGFLDILLNTGALGLIIFIWFYIKLGFDSLKKMMNKKKWMFTIPVLTLNYVLIGNIAYSFMLEVDQFVWILLIVWGFTRQDGSFERRA
jgi:O-antigen ligase